MKWILLGVLAVSLLAGCKHGTTATGANSLPGKWSRTLSDADFSLNEQIDLNADGTARRVYQSTSKGKKIDTLQVGKWSVHGAGADAELMVEFDSMTINGKQVDLNRFRRRGMNDLYELRGGYELKGDTLHWKIKVGVSKVLPNGIVEQPADFTRVK
jgi:hypothetical protein